jgi:hypothetical protein
VHPGPNGHLIMAYAFLKAMGLDGRIGTVTMDMAGTATTTEGHKVVAMDKGKVDLESARWPFCFQGDDKTPNGTRSILPYVPFCEDLNRFTLVVRGLSADKAKVTWGRMTRSFSKADLEAGINLAREFADNPFVEPFRKLDGLVFAKQDYETTLIKQTINSFPRLIQLSGKDPELTASVEALRTQAFATHEKMHAAARAAVVPVAHSIVVVPE